MKRYIDLNSNTTMLSLVFIAVMFGLIIRLYFILSANFPLNDGGMFFTMVQDLQNANYQLPFFTTYNHMQIPFVYPPLAFYIIGLASNISKIELIQLFRFMPLLFNVLGIPIFFQFSREILKSKFQQIVATFLFATLAPGYAWYIMGGGIARAPASLFLITALLFEIKAYKNKHIRHLIMAGIMGGLVAITHLEILWVFTFSSVIMLLYYCRTWKGGFLLICMGAISLFVSMPYWLSVLMRFGSSVFFSAYKTGGLMLINSLINIVYFNQLQETLIAIFSGFTIIGIIINLKTKNYYLPVWLLTTIILNTRSLERSAFICVCLLSAIGLDNVLVWLNGLEPKILNNLVLSTQIRNSEQEHTIPRLSKIIVFVLLFEILFFAFLGKFFAFNNQKGLNLENQEAMTWIKNNTLENSRYLVMPSASSWQYDSIGEWFPAISERESITTVQGSEWIIGSIFNERVDAYKNLQKCGSQGLKCLTSWEIKYKGDADYYYFSLNSQSDQGFGGYASSLEAEMRNSSEFESLLPKS